VHPEAVYLRRGAGEIAPVSQTVTLRSAADQPLVLEDATSGNPHIQVSLLPPRSDAQAQSIVVSLAESAPVGHHKGVVTVYTDLEGASVLQLRVYGDVTAQP
jgi:hypothetical protein